MKLITHKKEEEIIDNLIQCAVAHEKYLLEPEKLEHHERFVSLLSNIAKIVSSDSAAFVVLIAIAEATEKLHDEYWGKHERL